MKRTHSRPATGGFTLTANDTPSPINWRPGTADLIGSARQICDVQTRKAERLTASGTNSYKLLLYGPPGTGKTRTAELIALALTSGSSLGVEHFNGKEITVDTVREWMAQLPYGSLFSSWSVKIVNEFDRCSRDAQDLLLSYLDRLPPCKALIGTSNLHLEQLSDRLQTRFPAKRVDGPTQDEIVEMLVKNWPVPRDIANSIAFSSGGCVRAALADLENWLDDEGGLL